MSIVWAYLDKKAAAINALKDYDSMAYILEHAGEDIEFIHEHMMAPRNSTLTGLPSAHNPTAGENKLASCIDEIDVLKERYRQALEYMEWFRPAWDAITEEEKYILKVFFTEDGSKTDAVITIGEKLFIERSQVYRRKDKALARLALLLYGKSA